MFEKIYKLVVRWGYITGLFLLIISLPNSKWGMAMSQFVLAGSFVFERIDLRRAGKFFREKPLFQVVTGTIPYLLYLLFDSIVAGFRVFFRNKPALIFTSIMLLHLAGLIFTVNFDYALKDLRTKLPLFLLPLYISTAQPFNRRYFYGFLILFIAALLVRTWLNTWNYFHIDLIDIRNASRAVSHIIIALLISFAMFILGYFINKKRTFPLPAKIAFCLITAWFLIYLFFMQSLTGLIISSVTLMILMIILAFRSPKRWLRWVVSFAILAATSIAAVWFILIVRDYHKVNPLDLAHLESVTSRGNPYVHNTKDLGTENGNYLWIYIQWDELREEWAKRSPMSLDSTDKRNQKLLNTLVRFLTSKGERKDGDAVAKLTDREVRAIENGTANVIFVDNFGIRGRVYEFLHGYEEYRDKGNPTGSTVMQRFEFWKASLGIIGEYWLTGVGTGDMNDAFHRQYEKMNSKLAPDQRWRSHNQFLSIFIGFGIFGLAWFLFAIFYPPYLLGRYDDYFFLVFFIIAILSMIPEDTIESQAGVTFFAFFYSFLLFAKREEDRYEIITGSRSRS